MWREGGGLPARLFPQKKRVGGGRSAWSPDAPLGQDQGIIEQFVLGEEEELGPMRAIAPFERGGLNGYING